MYIFTIFFCNFHFSIASVSTRFIFVLSFDLVFWLLTLDFSLSYCATHIHQLNEPLWFAYCIPQFIYSFCFLNSSIFKVLNCFFFYYLFLICICSSLFLSFFFFFYHFIACVSATPHALFYSFYILTWLDSITDSMDMNFRKLR